LSRQGASSFRPFDGDQRTEVRRIAEADVVVNNGFECSLGLILLAEVLREFATPSR
jgi:hypothetical protein